MPVNHPSWLSARSALAAVAAAVAVSVSHAQQPADTAPHYVIRGRQVQVRQRELIARIERFREVLGAALRRDAPEWLARMEPPPSIVTGYQLLPRIVPDAAPAETSFALQTVSYSWAWSETLIQGETEKLSSLEAALSRVAHQPPRPLLDSIVTEYRKLLDRKKRVDADVDYNWLWQAAVARSPAPFDRATSLSTALLQLQSQRRSLDGERDGTARAKLADTIAARSAEVDRGLANDIKRTSIPGFVRFTRTSHGWIVTVPIVTDIQDSAFLAEFTRAVEPTWRAMSDDVAYAVRLDIKTISPRALYCGPVSRASPPATACAPPARGATIDLQAHIARFPPDGAVLTTGAGSTHVTAGRAIVISPHDTPRRLLAHEFGHLLGFRDAYLRGRRDAGAGGYIITELVVDQSDIMGNSKTGMVRASHFERLLAVKDLPALMRAGLSALYERHDPTAAVTRFRDVLERDPQHYGATVQLAKALDASGKAAEASEWWTRVLALAQEAGDSATIREARARIRG